jgi:hypothetical protein
MPTHTKGSHQDGRDSRRTCPDGLLAPAVPQGGPAASARTCSTRGLVTPTLGPLLRRRRSIRQGQIPDINVVGIGYGARRPRAGPQA